MAVLSSLLFLFFSTVFSQFDGNCSWTDPKSGYTFDLSKLTLDEGFYYGTSGINTFELNVCRVVPSLQCSENQGMLCQYDNNEYQFAWATWGHTESPEPFPTWSVIDDDPMNGVQLNFTNGVPTPCQNQAKKENRSSLIKFLCVPGKTDNVNFTIVEENQCSYLVQFESEYACPVIPTTTSPPLSAGSIILICLAITIPLYIIFGCIYKSKKLDTKGTESCPNVEFWRDLPSLVRDGCRFTFKCCKRDNNAYDQL